MKKLLLLLVLFSPLMAFSQDDESAVNEEVSAWGKYTGENVYVLNPSENGVFSVQEVTVDGKPYAFNHESNAFEVNLEGHELNDFVFVKITCLPHTKPLIINSESLIHESEFSLPSFVFNKKTKLLEWKATEMDVACNYRLEQMLYGKWIVVKKLGRPDDMIAENFLPVQISGMNMFRIVQTDEAGNELTSPVIKLKSPNKKVLLLSDKVKEYIEFTAVTHYELYDANGVFLKRGTAQKINVADLNKGTYWVNFDGKEAVVTKK
ncbi:MAG: T9SS type A sorting domain-containing protein [Bacteroidales bacterium]|nr:T9SS type A sorting domain-containing protein [Bacteroidales bacterium]